MIRKYEGAVTDYKTNKTIEEHGEGYICECDCCGVTLDPNDYPKLFDDACAARSDADDADWLVLGDVVICDSCREDIERGKIKVTAKFESKEERNAIQ